MISWQKLSRAALCHLDTKPSEGSLGLGAMGALQPKVNSSHSSLCVRRAVVCSPALSSIFAYPWQEALAVAVDFDCAPGHV